MERVQRDHPAQGFFDPDSGCKLADEDRDGGQGHRVEDKRLPQRLGENETRGWRTQTRYILTFISCRYIRN